jgi:hypothetical protein
MVYRGALLPCDDHEVVRPRICRITSVWLRHSGSSSASLVGRAGAALALWAGDEVLRGVNYFRHLLGVAMIAWLGLALVRLG